MSVPGQGLPRGQAAMLACLLEAAAPKVGNVHRGADFENLSFNDFLISAAAIGPDIDAVRETGVGPAILSSVKKTRQLVGTNTNLGMLLLMAPLAAIADGEPWQAGIVRVLGELTPADCKAVYAAIREAQPGGIGKAPSMDIHDKPPASLLAAMKAAADRDLIARQYVESFAFVFATAERLVALRKELNLVESIVRTHVELIGEHGDTLIARKCGPELALRAQNFAKAVLQAGKPGDEDYYSALGDFDFWLRADGNKRNPGTTADLIAGALFVGLRDARLSPPYR